MDRYRYSRQTVEKSRDLYRLLVTGDRPKQRRCLTYGQAGDAIGMHVRPLRFALHKIQDECLKTGRPVLTALVVRQDKGYPGEGCVVSEDRDFTQALDQIARTAWPVDPWW